MTAGGGERGRVAADRVASWDAWTTRAIDYNVLRYHWSDDTISATSPAQWEKLKARAAEL